ncbi:hypothetical protein L1987_51299 [Smallanthus sonchifolius]|uniref:Uncharacterized protein n=1 Tax=Smallanthus sonchifolius TaxID=185202 RepID=A0ACB9EPW8_9ASTR|nr:hypothetical protein L1987_51299 [Smallanthus sonchifolius]
MMYSILKYRGLLCLISVYISFAGKKRPTEIMQSWYDAANLDRNGTGSMLMAGVHVDDMDVLKARDVADIS